MLQPNSMFSFAVRTVGQIHCQLASSQRPGAHPCLNVNLDIQEDHQEFVLVLRQRQPNAELGQGVREAALHPDRDGGQRWVAAHRLSVPVDGVPQQTGNHIYRANEQVEGCRVEASAVCNAQFPLQTKGIFGSRSTDRLLQHHVACQCSRR